MGTAVLEPDVQVDRDVRLGPAVVRAVQSDCVRVATEDGEVRAQLALGYRYCPVPGDSVLVIRQQERCYVIAVLSGKGETVLSAPGDLKLAAPRGRIEIVASQGIRFRGPNISIDSKVLRIVAESVQEKFVNVSRWIREALQLRAGTVHTKVTSEYRVEAEEIIERARGDIKLDGRKIRLG